MKHCVGFVRRLHVARWAGCASEGYCSLGLLPAGMAWPVVDGLFCCLFGLRGSSFALSGRVMGLGTCPASLMGRQQQDWLGLLCCLCILLIEHVGIHTFANAWLFFAFSNCLIDSHVVDLRDS